MGRIIIRGDFTLEGDIPQLKLTVKRFKFAVLETIEYPMVKLTEFSGVECKHTETTKSGEGIYCSKCWKKLNTQDTEKMEEQNG